MYFLTVFTRNKTLGSTLKFSGLNVFQCFLLPVFFLIAVSTEAQKSTVDSLTIELGLHQKKDTIRVNLLNELAFSYFNNDIGKSLEHLDKAEEIAENIQFKKGRARSIYIRGLIESSKSNNKQAIRLFKKSLLLYNTEHYEKGVSDCFAKIGMAYYYDYQYNKSIENYKNSIEILNNIGQSKATAVSLKFIGFCYLDMGEYKKALEYFNKAMDINLANNDKLEMASCLNNMGTSYLHKGNYPLALEHYNQSLINYKILKDTAGISSVLNNLGLVYKKNKKFDEAIASYKESLKLKFKKNKINSKNKGISLNNIGVAYRQKKDYKNALIYLTEALEMSTSINDQDNIGRCLLSMGDVYLELKDYNIALQKFLKAKEINIELESQLGLCHSYLGLAKVYLNQKKIDLALINAIKCKEISNNIGAIDYQRDTYNLLSTIYENLGDFKKAFESHQQFKILNDSLFNKENVEKIAQLEYEYKYKQALDSASIRELRLTKTVLTTSKDLAKSKQNYLWAVIGILTVSILLSSLVFYQKFTTIKVKNQNILTEQKLLRSQMTPHFIFNSLSVLQGMILNKEEKKSVTYLSKFSKLLRIVLENSRDKLVPLIQELDAIDNYMMLQNMDADPPYNYSLVVDESIDINQLLIPPMLIQPFIENAIEHAFRTQQDNRELEVYLTLIDERLSCSIADNGIGIDAISKKSNTNKKSLATTITAERLQLLAKDFNVPGGISIEDRKKYNAQGTQVTLIIPYKVIENT
ncbi:tetratricopeptide repeat protein [Flagellimonas nanhaiensis]|uniref:Tetratricopeptide repeat protein n=1 Tax=Flagellimonas nanhaiensis TaxID=2292706 RepID=A0A371JW10_9FLAO|nr:tetratricopeptide repeat protein [Allomuricauda nanhaiensis]RDY61966.1 tetratricopeptide repeat protein [Allomuricauda nanhaiensis]